MDIIRKKKKKHVVAVVAPQTKGGKSSSYSSFSSVSTQTVKQQDFVTQHAYEGWNEHKLQKELHRIEKELAARISEQEDILESKHTIERRMEDGRLSLIQLFESRQTLRASYVNLLSHVYREAKKQKNEKIKLERELSEKQSRAAVSEELLLGLKIRLIRNKKVLWEKQKGDLRIKIHGLLRIQEDLSREIQILRAHKEHALRSMRIAARNDELAALSGRRRGKVISGVDLRVLSQNLEHFGKKKDLEVELESIVAKQEECKEVRNTIYRSIETLRQKEEHILLEKSNLVQELLKLQGERQKVDKPKKKKVKFSWTSFSWKNIKGNLQPAFVVFSISALVLPSILAAASYGSRGIAAKSFVLGSATQAVDSAKDAGKDLSTNDIAGATQNLHKTATAFADAQKALESLGPIVDLVQNVPLVSQVGTASHLLDAAKNISLASVQLTEVANKYSSVGSVLPENITGGKISQKTETNSFVDALTSTQEQVQEVDKLFMQAHADLQKAKLEDVPQGYQETLKPIFEIFPEIATTFHTFTGFYGQLPTLFGVDQQRKYLLMFLNNNELRGPGGFLGSFGLMDVDQGKIQDIKVYGTYDPDGQFQERLYPPAPIRIINPRWFMRDVFYPDFPTSAQKVMDFYEKSQGPSVDGAISFTPTIFEDLLRVTGPVEVPEQHATVNADNFLDVTQYKVEIDYDKKLNQPKKFLGDMMPHLVQKILSLPQEKWLDVAAVFVDALNEKSMQVYFRNPDLEQKAKDAGIGGEIKAAPRDYLNIVNNNMLGNKTDLLITQQVNHDVNISADGTVVDEVTVTRTHTGTYAWPSGRNRGFISLYVPSGAKLLSYSGFDTLESNDVPLICDECKEDPLVQSFEAGKLYPNSGLTTYEEFGKTVFAGWQYLDPGASKTYKVKYQLPFKVAVHFYNPASTYSLLVQKQSGSVDSKYRLNINIPNKLSYATFVPRGVTDIAVVKAGPSLHFETSLTSDKFFGTVITK